jgi:tRNA pseudouridine55 synthase
MSEAAPDGVLRVDKPAGPTSHDAVDRARRSLGTRRIGHTGTLDPFASGLLMLCVGSATRIAEYLSDLDKEYSATVRLGVTTDTDDLTGAPLAEADAGAVTRGQVERALEAQRGTVLQVPPRYSAKKRGGERAYAVARQGRELELDPVPVTIHRLELTAFRPPELDLVVRCSSGTYIRAIARDLGAALGVGAHLSALRRTAIGAHTAGGALSFAGLADPAHAAAALQPTLTALAHLPRHDVDDADAADIRHGRAVRVDGADDAAVIAIAAGGRLLGIGELQRGLLKPRKVLQ